MVALSSLLGKLFAFEREREWKVSTAFGTKGNQGIDSDITRRIYVRYCPGTLYYKNVSIGNQQTKQQA